jgi:hypothetical protein
MRYPLGISSIINQSAFRQMLRTLYTRVTLLHNVECQYFTYEKRGIKTITKLVIYYSIEEISHI